MKRFFCDPGIVNAAFSVQRLVRLRFVAIAGQTAAVTVAIWGLGLALPWVPLLLVLASLLAFNLLTVRRLRRGQSASFSCQLWIDCLALALVLGLTGGGTNPFAWLLLLPLVLAAMTLGRHATWVFGAVTIACYTVVAGVHVPLPGMPAVNQPGFRLHVLGMWVGFIVCVATIAYFVADMAQTLRERERDLAATRERALRNDHLLGLGIMAAGTAHELATPLSTMAVVVQEMGESEILKDDPVTQEQLGLLRCQIERCKRALSILSVTACEDKTEPVSNMTLGDYLERVVAQWRKSSPGHEVKLECAPCDRRVRITASHGLTQTLANLLQNAGEASREAITLKAFRRGSEIVMQVHDRGAGPDAIGDPRHPVKSTKGPGRGLGLYLAYGFVERLGGKLTFTAAPDRGTIAEVALPLSAETAAGEAHGT